MMMHRKYGWKRDHLDKRDFRYRPFVRPMALPASVDLRSVCPPVVDQGNLGSCTANGIASAHMFDQMKQGVAKPFYPARLFIYYNECVMEGTVGTDSGAEIRDGIKSVNKQGVCPETMWPYIISKFATKPKAAAYTEALKHQTISYASLWQSLSEIQTCLANGYPVVFGFSVYESFESDTVARTGNVPMPKINTESLLGGHCVLCVGYKNTTKKFICMNSWGTGWGVKGYFYLPYAYLTDPSLASDLWTIRVVEA